MTTTGTPLQRGSWWHASTKALPAMSGMFKPTSTASGTARRRRFRAVPPSATFSTAHSSSSRIAVAASQLAASSSTNRMRFMSLPPVAAGCAY